MNFGDIFQTTTACVLLASLSLFGVRSLHMFAAQNGLFKYFLDALDSNKTPTGRPLQVITTNGRVPKIDWQLKAPAVFVLAFTENLAHPDTTLAGLLFLGAWAPAWTLIVLESLRKCNQGTLAAQWVYVFFNSIMIPGLIIFNHSHSVGTPAYLAVHLLLAASVTATSADELRVEQQHLAAIPISFVFGYILPIILLAVPAPKIVTWTFKHTTAGWYQQWSLVIAVFHYAYVYIMADNTQSTFQSEQSGSSPITLLRIVYALAFMMAQLPHWIVCVISFTAWLCPSMFNEKKVESLKPPNLLVPTLPFAQRKAKNMAEGFLWLLQWDYVLGTLGTIVWSLVLHSNAREVYGVDDTWPYMFLRFLGYTIVGGPAALPVMLLWERDEWVFGGRA